MHTALNRNDWLTCKLRHSCVHVPVPITSVRQTSLVTVSKKWWLERVHHLSCPIAAVQLREVSAVMASYESRLVLQKANVMASVALFGGVPDNASSGTLRFTMCRDCRVCVNWCFCSISHILCNSGRLVALENMKRVYCYLNWLIAVRQVTPYLCF